MRVKIWYTDYEDSQIATTISQIKGYLMIIPTFFLGVILIIGVIGTPIEFIKALAKGEFADFLFCFEALIVGIIGFCLVYIIDRAVESVCYAIANAYNASFKENFLEKFISSMRSLWPVKRDSKQDKCHHYREQKNDFASDMEDIDIIRANIMKRENSSSENETEHRLSPEMTASDCNLNISEEEIEDFYEKYPSLKRKEKKAFEENIEIIKPQVIKKESISPKTNNLPQKDQEVAFCRKCGTQLLNDSKFCHKCGCEKVH